MHAGRNEIKWLWDWKDGSWRTIRGNCPKRTPHIIKTCNDDKPSKYFDAWKLIKEEISKYQAKKEKKCKERQEKESTESIAKKRWHYYNRKRNRERYYCEMQGKQIKEIME